MKVINESFSFSLQKTTGPNSLVGMVVTIYMMFLSCDCIVGLISSSSQVLGQVVDDQHAAHTPTSLSSNPVLRKLRLHFLKHSATTADPQVSAVGCNLSMNALYIAMHVCIYHLVIRVVNIANKVVAILYRC